MAPQGTGQNDKAPVALRRLWKKEKGPHRVATHNGESLFGKTELASPVGWANPVSARLEEL